MRHNCDALDLIMSALLYDLFKTAHTSFSEFFRILSSREKGHGIGLSSIRATAEKYHGLARFEYHEQEFSASIMLKLAPSAADPAKL